MKTILFLTLFFSTTLFAESMLSMSEFEKLTVDQQVSIISAYKDFLRESSEKTKLDKFSSYRFSFITEAIAAGEFDCFYAGWPSRSSRSGGKRLCTSPLTGNPDYRSRASSCGSNSLLCQPAIFGSGICVSVATAALKNSAFSQCENKFRESGKTLADVAAELNTPAKKADLEELLSVSERVCREGFQQALCNRLREKILAVKNQNGEGATLIAATTTAIQATQTTPEPEVDCDPNTPGIQTTPPQRPAQVTPIPLPRPSITKRGCTSPPQTGPAPSMAELQPVLRANNIHIVAGTVTDTRILKKFLDDFNRFPQPLREEMKRKGSRINLIVGQGVSEDPSWAEEARRAARPADWVNTHDGRPWSQVPGAGGSLGNPPTPTRIVINRLNQGHGASNLFLHEYGHTLDSMYGHHAITATRQWKDALAADTRSREFIQSICGNYCNDAAHPEEAFAELFSYYHACAETKNHMQAFMPAISNFFDKLTNVRALLDGRLDMSMPTPVPRVAADDSARRAITVSGAAGSAGSIPRPVVARVDSPRVSAQTVPQDSTKSPERSPQSSSQGSAGETIGPVQALAMVNSGQLKYNGRGMLPGSDTVGSCVYSNAQVYVIVHACRRDGREAPALNIDIITRDGQKTNFYIENSEQTDRTVGMPSQVRRQNYDRAWRVSYQQLGPVPETFSFDSMRPYLQNGVGRIQHNCYVGGMMNQDGVATCNGDLMNEQRNWGPGANEFYNEPGDAFYSFLRSMRQKVQSNAGR